MIIQVAMKSTSIFQHAIQEIQLAQQSNNTS